jgi:hypothetical protein
MKKQLIALCCALGVSAPAFATESATVIPLYSMIPIVITAEGDLTTAHVFNSGQNFQGHIGKYAESGAQLIDQLQTRACKFAFTPTKGNYGSQLLNVTEAQMSCRTEGGERVAVTLTGSLKTPTGSDGVQALEVGQDAIFLVQKAASI